MSTTVSAPDAPLSVASQSASGHTVSLQTRNEIKLEVAAHVHAKTTVPVVLVVALPTRDHPQKSIDHLNVAGTFSEWQPQAMDSLDGSLFIRQIEADPDSEVHFKFVTDNGYWFVNPVYATTCDSAGNVNNLLRTPHRISVEQLFNPAKCSADAALAAAMDADRAHPPAPEARQPEGPSRVHSSKISYQSPRSGKACRKCQGDHHVSECKAPWCEDCGNNSHNRSECPNQACRKCHGKGHFASSTMCPKASKCGRCGGNHAIKDCKTSAIAALFARQPVNEDTALLLRLELEAYAEEFPEEY